MPGPDAIAASHPRRPPHGATEVRNQRARPGSNVLPPQSRSDPLSPATSQADPFAARLAASGTPSLRRDRVTTLQVNIGLRCNLACHHCHVESGPNRRERLDRVGIERILTLLERSPEVSTLDITGGAPELHPRFRELVRGARGLGRRVIDRCNLTVLSEPGQLDTAEFLAAQQVHVVASLPCHGPDNVEKQRGRGVFARSIEALQRLNALGYARPGTGLFLDLVYNPVGATLPPPQSTLEAEYRQVLRAEHGIEFDHLLTIANMPIRRFRHALERDGLHDEYLALLEGSFNPEVVPHLMCRGQISVAHDGTLHDCDFHLATGLDLEGGRRTIFEIENLGELAGTAIRTARHCFGCTAGAGSSCGGSLT